MIQKHDTKQCSSNVDQSLIPPPAGQPRKKQWADIGPSLVPRGRDITDNLQTLKSFTDRGIPWKVTTGSVLMGSLMEIARDSAMPQGTSETLQERLQSAGVSYRGVGSNIQ